MRLSATQAFALLSLLADSSQALLQLMLSTATFIYTRTETNTYLTPYHRGASPTLTPVTTKVDGQYICFQVPAGDDARVEEFGKALQACYPYMEDEVNELEKQDAEDANNEWKLAPHKTAKKEL